MLANDHDGTDGFTYGFNAALHQPCRSVALSSGFITSHPTVIVIATEAKPKCVDTNKQDNERLGSQHARATNPRQPSWAFLVAAPDTTCWVYSSRSLHRPVQRPTVPAHSPRLLSRSVTLALQDGSRTYCYFRRSASRSLYFLCHHQCSPYLLPTLYTPSPDEHAKHAS